MCPEDLLSAQHELYSFWGALPLLTEPRAQQSDKGVCKQFDHPLRTLSTGEEEETQKKETFWLTG